MEEHIDKKADTELMQCQEALQQAQERYRYLIAEHENYKKRVDRERSQWIEEAHATVLKDLLPIADNFERALAELKAQQIPKEIASHFMGIELILKELHKLFKNYNLEEISTQGLFNPEFHEAITQIEAPEHASGSIVDVYQKGYIHKGRILRPAQVSVAR